LSFATRTLGNQDSPIDYGNTTGEFEEAFQTDGEFIHLRGGETVLASRLQGRHVQVIRVRATALPQPVDSDWRVTDVVTGVAFNIRDVTVSEDRRSVDLLCESGVAA
jgi:hypothetical protein